MQFIRIGSVDVSRVILGGNPISGFSHQSSETDKRMLRYFTTEQTKRLFRHAEDLGVTTFLGRCDKHVTRLMIEYRQEGGRIRWIAQSCPEFIDIEISLGNAAAGDASAIFLHGGYVDHLYGNRRLDEAAGLLEKMKASGIPVGFASHIPEVHRWAAENVDIDFHMCSYYNPSSRAANPAGAMSGPEELFHDDDRDAMVETIATLAKPVIHYKVFAAGRKDPAEAMEFAARHMRPSDAVCIGIYDEDDPDMLRRDIELLESHLLTGAK